MRIDSFGMKNAGGMAEDESGRRVTSTHLAPFVIHALQPLFDGMAVRTHGREPVPLADIEIILGSTDGRGRFKSERGSVIRTPGETEAGYLSTLKSLLHELGHQIQSRAYPSEAEFLRTWHEQDDQYGQGAYFQPGTLEYEAEQFKDAVFAARGALGL